jgi:hypothetical protein
MTHVTHKIHIRFMCGMSFPFDLENPAMCQNSGGMKINP